MLHIHGRVLAFVVTAVIGAGNILLQPPSNEPANVVSQEQQQPKQGVTLDRSHYATYCYGYDQGLSREEMVTLAARHYLQTLPDSFFDIPNMSKKAQAVFFAMTVSDNAVNHVCPVYQDKQFTEDEYRALLPEQLQQPARKQEPLLGA